MPTNTRWTPTKQTRGRKNNTTTPTSAFRKNIAKSNEWKKRVQEMRGDSSSNTACNCRTNVCARSNSTPEKDTISQAPARQSNTTYPPPPGQKPTQRTKKDDSPGGTTPLPCFRYVCSRSHNGRVAGAACTYLQTNRKKIDGVENPGARKRAGRARARDASRKHPRPPRASIPQTRETRSVLHGPEMPLSCSDRQVRPKVRRSLKGDLQQIHSTSVSQQNRRP